MNKRVGEFVGLLTLVLLAGCSGAPNSSIATAESAMLRSDRTTLPVTYSTYADPQPLTDSQLHEIREIINGARPRRPAVWFLHVHYNKGATYRVTIFFPPKVADGRVQHGERFVIDNEVPPQERAAILKQLGVDPGNWPSRLPYVRVLMSAEAARDSRPPAEENLPFSPPQGLSDAELVTLVDVARAALQETDEPQPMPIQRVEPLEGGRFRVYFGWQAGPLHGAGRCVDLTPHGASFSANGVGMWVS